MEEMRKQYSDIAQFLYIYIKEAHPDDEWQMDVNRSAEVVFPQPKTFDERLELAQKFVTTMGIEGETLVDDIGNTANACFAAWPERLYVIDKGGTITYKGGMGPFYFDPDELEQFLKSTYGS
jgi:hypothetical protein